MYKHLLLSIVLSITVLSAYATPSWEINSKGGIEWKIKKEQLPHKDHIEMSGEQMAFVLRWGIDANGVLELERQPHAPLRNRCHLFGQREWPFVAEREHPSGRNRRNVQKR